MECPSSETLSLLTEPALTRFRASQPRVAFAVTVNKGVVVLLQASGGRELAL